MPNLVLVRKFAKLARMKPRFRTLLLFGLEILANVVVIVILVVILRTYVLSPF